MLERDGLIPGRPDKSCWKTISSVLSTTRRQPPLQPSSSSPSYHMTSFASTINVGDDSEDHEASFVFGQEACDDDRHTWLGVEQQQGHDTAAAVPEDEWHTRNTPESSSHAFLHRSASSCLCYVASKLSASRCARISGRWRWMSTVCCSCSWAGFLLLIFFHAFALPLTHPYVQSITCAATLMDCEACVANQATFIQCPPRCSDFFDDAATYAVYGSNNTYRGDSKICRAAIHHGIMSVANGGCAQMRIGGPVARFAGSTRNGIESFDAEYFPYSFSFSDPQPSRPPFGMSLQWGMLSWLLLSWILAALLQLSAAHTWTLLIFQGFWYLTFTARGGSAYSCLLVGTRWFLPLVAIAAVLWRIAAKQAFLPCQAQPWKIVLCYVLPFALALHLDFATLVVPSVTVTPGGFSKGPGALILLLFLALLVLVVIGYHGVQLYRASLALTYAVPYLAVIIILVLLSFLLVGQASPHIHHSLSSMFLFPLTRFPTVPSLITQGLLAGVMVNGIAYWGLSPPWDPSPISFSPPTCAPRVLFQNASLMHLDWECGPLPSSLQFALNVNGAWMYQGIESSCIIGHLLPSSNLTLALAHVLPDGAVSKLGPITLLHT